MIEVGDINFKAPGYGEVTPPTDFLFLRGHSYPITLTWLGTNLPAGPDYDYTALVTPAPAACAIVDDPQNLLGVVNNNNPPPNENSAQGKVATLILPTGDLTVYRPNTPPFQQVAVPDAIEETSNDPAVHAGAGVRFNGDDDNGNGVPDHTESPVTNEDDLVRVDVLGEMPDLPDTYEWVLKRSNSAIKVWTDWLKVGAEVFNGDDIGCLAAAPNGEAWYIEWVDPNTNTATLELGVREVGGTEVCVLDTIALYRFRSIVIALGGEGHNPTDPADPNHGTFQLAIDLYQNGYDLHMYNEDAVDINGAGAAYNEVDSAVQNRAITEVAIFGYSHGGGATHDLAERLKDFPPPGGVFAIPFTAYIDAVTQGTFTAENRRPPLTTYHVNYYETNSFLNGGPVENSNPPPTGLDVTTTPWGAAATHTTIDDLPQVLSGIESQLTPRVNR